ncbi:MBL fold metallo-hydrolase [Modestobacter sp. Leaf380]|uniref:MBL fold metallo-hydrolase n=1 Tax=Modestobacter sp. Leaf380 TaxID=1736356 RepID=UPI0006FEA147|nr:MBL fold metallo-hydrolase [Modestobacter sp. Leaf380]KQS63652.1 beta-hydroxylase [Modestobacter sp. Leaf380]
MSSEPLYLRPNVRIEGLVNRFVAWTHVYAPVTGAMTTANLLLPIMDSFVQHPEVHEAAVANPKMKGGFFIAAPSSRVDEVADLRDSVVRDDKVALAFAEAVTLAEEMLRARATGFDLSPLYALLPPELRGVTELVYDTDHHATLRFLEPLLYRSEVHRRERESVDLSLDDGTSPPFILSTPRLPAPGHLQLPLQLDHPGIDDLFSLRSRARPLAEVAAALEIGDGRQEELLRSLLTPDRSPVADRDAEGGRIRYFGHACLLLQAPGASVLVDPFISSDTAAGDRFTYEDLPDTIDLVLITHAHQDHVVLETLLQLRHRVGTVVVPRNGGGQRQDPSLRLFLEAAGMRVREVDDLDEITFPGGSVVAAPFFGEHCDLDIRAKSSYWVRIAGRNVFVGADTSGLESELYAQIRRTLGRADMAFIGMECDGAPLSWLYSSLFTQPVPRKMAITRKLSGSNAAQASAVVAELGAPEAYVYAMGQEDWLQHVMATSYTPASYQLLQVKEFLSTCADRGVHAEHLLVREELRW